MSDVVVRRATRDDVPALLALHESIYGKPIDEAFYRWKLIDDSPYLPGTRVWMAEVGGRVVSTSGIMLFPFWMNGREILAGALVDTRVVREARRKGLFAAAYGGLHDAVSAAGVSLELGMPNQMSIPFLPKLGLHFVARSIWMRRRLGWLGRWRQAKERACSVRRVDPDAAVCDALWERLGSELDLCSIPRAAYLRHRFLQCPGRAYDLLLAQDALGPCGLLVLGARGFGRQREATVAHVWVAPKASGVLADLVDAAAHVARRRGYWGMRALIKDTAEHQDRWGGMGFRPAEGDFETHVRADGEPLVPGIFQSAEAFFPQLGDHDFV